jgi:hypothetical protein
VISNNHTLSMLDPSFKRILYHFHDLSKNGYQEVFNGRILQTRKKLPRKELVNLGP